MQCMRHPCLVYLESVLRAPCGQLTVCRQTVDVVRVLGFRAYGHLPRTVSIPASTNSRREGGSLPTRSVRRSLSTLTIRETLATKGLGRPVRRAGRSTFPGARAHLRLLVSGTHTTVAMRLRFNASPCTTTGLLNPGAEVVMSFAVAR